MIGIRFFGKTGLDILPSGPGGPADVDWMAKQVYCAEKGLSC